MQLSLDSWLNIASNLLDNEPEGGSRPSHYLRARLRDKYEKHSKYSNPSVPKGKTSEDDRTLTSELQGWKFRNIHRSSVTNHRKRDKLGSSLMPRGSAVFRVWNSSELMLTHSPGELYRCCRAVVGLCVISGNNIGHVLSSLQSYVQICESLKLFLSDRRKPDQHIKQHAHYCSEWRIYWGVLYQ